jgi:hypothetical protein
MGIHVDVELLSRQYVLYQALNRVVVDSLLISTKARQVNRRFKIRTMKCNGHHHNQQQWLLLLQQEETNKQTTTTTTTKERIVIS